MAGRCRNPTRSLFVIAFVCSPARARAEPIEGRARAVDARRVDVGIVEDGGDAEERVGVAAGRREQPYRVHGPQGNARRDPHLFVAFIGLHQCS